VRLGRVGEAVAAFRHAICLDPREAIPYGGLGQALLRQGEFAEATAATLRCLDLLPPGHPLRTVSTRQVEQCERWLALEGKLPAVLRGQAEPAGAAERLALAQLCQRHKRLYAASARFYAEAFAGRPPLAEDLRAGRRWDAACAAALAAAGEGADAGTLGEQERGRWRKQALAWLRADLAARARLGEAAPQAREALRRALTRWRQEPALAGVRDKEALARLPAAEAAAWMAFWAEVDALLARARLPAEAPGG
jgi:serine/threonine-protein kinase